VRSILNKLKRCRFFLKIGQCGSIVRILYILRASTPPFAFMSFLSIALAIALLLAITSWLTGYRLPIYRKVKGGEHTSIQRARGVSRSTRNQLLRLVGGNTAVAQRLVSDVSDRNPTRTEQWCWEKAIYDIERDRRA